MTSSKMMVSDFERSTTSEELKELFSAHGRVKQIELIPGRGLGFVEMFKKSEAKKAVIALNGSEFKNSTLKVQEARRPDDNRRKRHRRR